MASAERLPETTRTAENWRGLWDTVAECDKVVTDVDGRIPEGLAGTLYRNGPGTHDWTRSFFDGDGMIRAVRIGATSHQTPSRHRRTAADGAKVPSTPPKT